ncbi:hypothetical protein J437_LFUL015665 [Ladona fulva]|uniref:Aquaporin n=1 Tax=Ladona fulva TaxID=123851 RepID=A0A8K0KJD1_LADFU|nr:hypothetical protein J437_LFUL015665 [Ladona fulva]
MASIYDFIISLASIGLILTIAYVIRNIVRGYFEAAQASPFLQILIEEAIAAAELCGCCFELIIDVFLDIYSEIDFASIVADNYGVSAYAVLLFLLTIWWSSNWADATACPYNHLEDYVSGNTDLFSVILKGLAELIGGVSIFKLIQYLWALEWAETHKGRAYEECSADLQVSMMMGALIEGVAVCICRICSRALGDLEVKYSTVIDAFIGTSLVVLAFNYSGGYFNPVLATSLKFGCKGNTFVEHMVVYWIGACLGALLSVVIYRQPMIQNKIHGKQD